LTELSCRECGRSDALFAGAVAFTCSSCLMNGADYPPTCRRCLGAHWDAQCEYNVTEAQAAFSARVAAREGHHSAPTSTAREIGSVTESPSVSAVAISSPSSGPANKTSRPGRPRIDPSSKGSGAAARQRAYRRRQRARPLKRALGDKKPVRTSQGWRRREPI
jgi:hypothetical protein